MTVNIGLFDDDPHILVFQFVGNWTVVEWIDGLKASSELQKSASIEYIIFDATQSKHIPNGFLSSIQAMRNNFHGTIKRRILVGANSFLKALMDVLNKVAPGLVNKFAFVDTMDDARTLIAAMRNPKPAVAATSRWKRRLH